MTSSKLSQSAGRRRGEVRGAIADRQVAYTGTEHRHLSGRSWINGQEVGGRDARYAHLEETYD